jgi:hypothetical protein
MGFSHIAAVAMLSYYFSGRNMLAFHGALDPVDQPGYMGLSRTRRVLAAVIWPAVAQLNGELGWFALTYCATLFVVTAAYSLLGLYLESTFWRVLIISGASFTPVLAVPFAFVATVLWMLVGRPLRWRVPFGMERLK